MNAPIFNGKNLFQSENRGDVTRRFLTYANGKARWSQNGIHSGSKKVPDPSWLIMKVPSRNLFMIDAELAPENYLEILSTVK